MRPPLRDGARPRPRALSRLRRALIPALLLLAAGPPAAALAYDDAGYLAYADRMQERLDPPGTRRAASTGRARAASTRSSTR